jgi:hypothetical protein
MMVLLDWVAELPLMMQSVLLSATRACDGISKHDVSKKLVRKVRAQVFVDARPVTKQSFLQKDTETFSEIVQEFCSDIDKYPVHFVSHIWFALEIIGYLHPDKNIKAQYFAAYSTIIDSLHLNIETKAQLHSRLDR